jgi:CDP-diacylglycerol---serine O-phosphatidyltransferase
MKSITRFIPSIITSLSLVSGFVALIYSFTGDFNHALLWVIIASVFDFMDGFAARMFNAVSEFGKQLDSLSDVISFGVVPGVAGVVFMSQLLGVGAISNLVSISSNQLLFLIPPALITVLSAIRLAKFNIDTRQSDHFIGLPTPANALMVLSFILFFGEAGIADFNNWFLVTAFSAFFLLSASLLVMPVDLLALKFKNYKFVNNWHRYLILLFAVVGVLMFGLSAIFMVIVFYILLSLIVTFVKMPIKS